MAYCTPQEVRDMIKDDVINALIGNNFIDDLAQREAHIFPVIEGAVSDADAEIDGYLAKRYPTPLDPPPKVINKISKDIAVYNLFSRMGIDESSEEKNYLNRYHAAIKFLTLVADGKVSLGTNSEDPVITAKTGFSVKSSQRLFDRDKLRGM